MQCTEHANAVRLIWCAGYPSIKDSTRQLSSVPRQYATGTDRTGTPALTTRHLGFEYPEASMLFNLFSETCCVAHANEDVDYIHW